MNPQPKRRQVKLSPAELARLRVRVLEADGFRCRVCGWPVEWPEDGRMRTHLEAHHVEPRGRFRLDVIGNLVTACAPACHGDASDGRILIRWAAPVSEWDGVPLGGETRDTREIVVEAIR